MAAARQPNGERFRLEMQRELQRLAGLQLYQGMVAELVQGSGSSGCALTTAMSSGRGLLAQQMKGLGFEHGRFKANTSAH